MTRWNVPTSKISLFYMGKQAPPQQALPGQTARCLLAHARLPAAAGQPFESTECRGRGQKASSPRFVCKADSPAGCPSAPQSPAPREGSCRSPGTRQGRSPRGHVSGQAGGLRSQGRAATHPPSSCPGAGYSTFFSFQTDFESLPSGRVNVSFSHSPSAGDKRFGSRQRHLT